VNLFIWLLGKSRIYSYFEGYFLNAKAGDIQSYSKEFLSSPSQYRLHRIGEIFAEQRGFLLQTLKEKSNSLVFAHVACPHAPSHNHDDVFKLDMYQAYADNLKICDKFIGDLIKELNQAQYMNGWTLVVTSDHWFRGRDWLESGKPLSLPLVRRTVPFYVMTDGESAAKVTNVLTNSRVLRKLLINALDKNFTLDKAKEILDAQGDSLTVLHPF
jgi:hypothetical protein